MTIKKVVVRVPATSANLGPGFDCLAMALDLWNEAKFSITNAGFSITINGEGKGILGEGKTNLVIMSFLHFYEVMGLPRPMGVALTCDNQIPLGSGLGSSTSAILLGIAAANEFSKKNLPPLELLKMTSILEGHVDNAAAAIFGGLVVVAASASDFEVKRFELPMMKVVSVIPEFKLPTAHARDILPKTVQLSDAVYNMSRIVLVVEALRLGDFPLLGRIMGDHLHQPYRFDLIPGAQAAIDIGLEHGADAVVLSGAGPGLIAFCSKDWEKVGGAMADAFHHQGLHAKIYILPVSQEGMQVNLL
jgi:homoserine kinase